MENFTVSLFHYSEPCQIDLTLKLWLSGTVVVYYLSIYFFFYNIRMLINNLEMVGDETTSDKKNIFKGLIILLS